MHILVGVKCLKMHMLNVLVVVSDYMFHLKKITSNQHKKEIYKHVAEIYSGIK